MKSACEGDEALGIEVAGLVFGGVFAGDQLAVLQLPVRKAHEFRGHAGITFGDEVKSRPGIAMDEVAPAPAGSLHEAANQTGLFGGEGAEAIDAVVGIESGFPEREELGFNAGLADDIGLVGEEALHDEGRIVEEALHAEVVGYNMEIDAVVGFEPINPWQAGDGHEGGSVEFGEGINGILGVEEDGLGIVLEGGHDHDNGNLALMKRIDGVGAVHGKMGAAAKDLLDAHGIGATWEDGHLNTGLAVVALGEGLIEATVFRLGKPIGLQDNGVRWG